MKIIAFILIMLSSTLFGFMISNGYKARITFFEKLILSLDIIKSELKYGKTPLEKLLSNINKNSIILEIGYFSDVENYLKQSISPEKAFSKADKKAFEKYSLKQSDKEILVQIPDIFKNENSSTALKSAEKLIGSIEALTLELKESFKSKSKLSKGLGVLFGIFIIIIFI
ncbi:MAG: stage III sporulation protein AB [Clostridia bacterium]